MMAWSASPSQLCNALDSSGQSDAWMSNQAVLCPRHHCKCDVSHSHSEQPDFMRGVPWTFTLSAQLKSISSIATHALEGANSIPHSLGVSKHNCAPVRLDLFVLLQPAPYFACPPLCPNNCLSHALQHHCILAGVRIICIRHNRSIIYTYIYI